MPRGRSHAAAVDKVRNIGLSCSAVGSVLRLRHMSTHGYGAAGQRRDARGRTIDALHGVDYASLGVSQSSATSKAGAE